jgi:hypothetical protein
MATTAPPATVATAVAPLPLPSAEVRVTAGGSGLLAKFGVVPN